MWELEKCQATSTQISVHAERSQVCEFYLREREEASDIINTSMHSSDKSLS